MFNVNIFLINKMLYDFSMHLKFIFLYNKLKIEL